MPAESLFSAPPACFIPSSIEAALLRCCAATPTVETVYMSNSQDFLPKSGSKKTKNKILKHTSDNCFSYYTNRLYTP